MCSLSGGCAVLASHIISLSEAHSHTVLARMRSLSDEHEGKW